MIELINVYMAANSIFRTYFGQKKTHLATIVNKMWESESAIAYSSREDDDKA